MRISFSRICYFCWLLTPWQTYSSCTSLIVSVEEGSLFPEKMNTSLARFNTWSLLALFVTCMLKIQSNRTKRMRSNTAADALLARKWFGHDPSASHHYGSSLKYKVVRKINTSWLWMSMYWVMNSARNSIWHGLSMWLFRSSRAWDLCRARWVHDSKDF